MNTLQRIAVKIAERGKYQGWKAGTKTADKQNLEAWCGALAALEVTGQADDYRHVTTVVAMVISVRGYRETLKIAADATSNQDGS